MKFNRRAFLQQIGVTLTALGVSQSRLWAWGDRYYQAIAQSTPRKLALLIGINQYPDSAFKTAAGDGAALMGCVTDVQLQAELLIHRFGFQPSDIVTLTDAQATRAAIETAWLEHLTAQARPGDVVVIHFSGLGSQVRLQTEASSQDTRTLVPVDGRLPTQPGDPIQDLPLPTLWLLLRSLKTPLITTILDTSFSPPTQVVGSSLRGRSRLIIPTGPLSPEARDFQAQQFTQLKITPAQLEAQQRTGQVPGVFLTAAAAGGLALESQWDGFRAGVFTYALTQQLWATTPASTLRLTLSRASAEIAQHLGSTQRPGLLGQKISDLKLLPYYLPIAPDTTAEGAVLAVDSANQMVTLWAGGLAPGLLAYYGVGSVVAIVSQPSVAIASPNPNPATPLAPTHLYQIRSRTGVTLKGKWLQSLDPVTSDAIAPVQVGDRMLDLVRVLPRDVGLTIALDDSLERIERVDATSAFSSVASVTAVVTGDQPADSWFGKVPALLTTGAGQPDQPLAPVNSYGLFGGRRVAIPNTLTDSDEAVKTAISRIAPHLQTLLAIKLVRLTANASSSGLAVRAALELVAPQQRLVMERQTGRTTAQLTESQIAPLMAGDGDVPSLPVDSRIQYRLQNHGDRPVYFALLGLDSSGEMIALYPTPLLPDQTDAKSTVTPADAVIQPGQAVLVPAATVSSEWVIHGPQGYAETQLIFSARPLRRTFVELAAAMPSVGTARRIGPLSPALAVARAILADLHETSQLYTQGWDLPVDRYNLHREAWATLSFVYQIV